MARSVCSHPFRPFHMQNCCGNRAEPSRLCSSCIILTIHHTTYIAHKTCRLKSDNALEPAGAPLLQLRPRIGLQLPLGAAPKYRESDRAACCLCICLITPFTPSYTVYRMQCAKGLQPLNALNTWLAYRMWPMSPLVQFAGAKL